MHLVLLSCARKALEGAGRSLPPWRCPLRKAQPGTEWQGPAEQGQSGPRDAGTRGRGDAGTRGGGEGVPRAPGRTFLPHEGCKVRDPNPRVLPPFSGGDARALGLVTSLSLPQLQPRTTHGDRVPLHAARHPQKDGVLGSAPAVSQTPAPASRAPRSPRPPRAAATMGIFYFTISKREKLIFMVSTKSAINKQELMQKVFT
ncbi:uncharacterized protein LOC119045271 [Artibeus jamaicensis]|uniref:uncharacterized protein LOC119045271 n=1 Tax=Artibeus jamaicensis TaxID=9417 RepID=UPI00235AFC59|nr:uncharacterized protein LOC119045271 [Artibeus jamaicensis]